jgi:adenylate cyclase
MAEQALQSFLFADLCGYSAITERVGDEAAAELAIEFASSVAALAAEHDAELIKRVGDAVMVRGSCARKTVELGLRIHSELTRKQGFPRVHAGVHTGVAVERGGDWWGTTVNLASRVANEAAAGELLLTEATKAAAGDLANANLRGLGARRFKNISKTVQVFAATGPDRKDGADPSRRTRLRWKRPQSRRRFAFSPRLA